MGALVVVYDEVNDTFAIGVTGDKVGLKPNGTHLTPVRAQGFSKKDLVLTLTQEEFAELYQQMGHLLGAYG